MSTILTGKQNKKQTNKDTKKSINTLLLLVLPRCLVSVWPLWTFSLPCCFSFSSRSTLRPFSPAGYPSSGAGVSPSCTMRLYGNYTPRSGLAICPRSLRNPIWTEEGINNHFLSSKYMYALINTWLFWRGKNNDEYYTKVGQHAGRTKQRTGVVLAEDWRIHIGVPIL